MPGYLMLPLLRGYEGFRATKDVQNFTRGLTSTSVGLIFAATVQIGQRTLTGSVAWAVFSLALVLVYLLRWSDPKLNHCEEQIRLAKLQGEAMQQALQHMTQKEAHGQQMIAGEYIVAWANEKAEGLYMLRNGQLEWQEPQHENTHLEVAVCSAADGRFIPGLTVYATLIDQQGNVKPSVGG